MKRRAKSGLIRVNVDWNEAKQFIQDHLGKEIKVCLPFCLHYKALCAGHQA